MNTIVDELLLVLDRNTWCHITVEINYFYFNDNKKHDLKTKKIVMWRWRYKVMILIKHLQTSDFGIK